MRHFESINRPASAAAIERIEWVVSDLAIELPSWGFVNTGTRFRVFPQAGVPRDAFEKIDDAATVHRYTGIAGSVALGFGVPFFAAAQAEIDARCRIEFARGTRIVPGALGADGPLIGAAAVALHATR